MKLFFSCYIIKLTTRAELSLKYNLKCLNTPCLWFLGFLTKHLVKLRRFKRVVCSLPVIMQVEMHLWSA